MAAAALAWLPLTCLVGCGDVTLGSVAAAALARFPPACVAGYDGDAHGSIAAVALEWLPPACLAGYGDTTNETRATLGLVDWFCECLWSLALGVYGRNSPTKDLRGLFMVVGLILAFAASNRGRVMVWNS